MTRLTTSSSFLVSVLLAAVNIGLVVANITRPIPTIRLDLTIKNRRQLLRHAQHQPELHQRQDDESSELPLSNGSSSSSHSSSSSRTLSSIEAALQSTAETHLASIYASQFSTTPSQVLLTVVTDENDAPENKSNGIYIRSTFLGGVVSFPDNDDPSGSGTDGLIPSRYQLERVTLAAFAIPGMGEPFLKALQEKDHKELEGLLLIGATEVKKDGYGGDGWEDTATTNGGSSNSNGNVANTNNGPTTQHDDGSNDMNIWAVAAVAALGAMFLVIVLCTSILYCDWRKRKERREKKRERQAAMAMANYNNGRGVSSKKSNKSKSDVDNESFGNHHIMNGGLQITVPNVGSGETEEMNVSPSTQGSGRGNTGGEGGEVAYSKSMSGSSRIMVQNSNHTNGSTSKGGAFMGKIVKSKRSLVSSVKSKAANAQLQEAENELLPNGYNHNTAEDGYAVPEIAPSVDYSVGEDTTMLYPTINRGRTQSKDNMSDFDGYSMDGMSAVDGGYSQFGGSGNNMSGVVSSNNASGKKSRDMYYTGEVPRDFDSVWDDESKLTTDGATTDGSVDAYNRLSPVRKQDNKRNNSSGDVANKEAYADLNNSLNKLVENEYENSSQSQSAISGNVGGGEHSTINLHEFDSESESGGSARHGAFTLELLGQKSKKANNNNNHAGGSSIAPSQEDEDSILGDMYRDETSDVLGGLMDDDSDGVSELSDKKGTRMPSSGDSVDSTPSWAAPIQSALRNSIGIFRSSAAASGAVEPPTSLEETAGSTPRSMEYSSTDNDSASSSQEQRTKEKFVSSLSNSGGDDNASVGSARSRNSQASRSSHASNRSSSSSSSSHKNVAANKSSSNNNNNEKALGLTNSMEEEVDEDPAAMIDNINSMLSECREILDTENN